MIETPGDLTDKERQLFSPHAADTGKLALQDAPEAFDVVRMNIAAHEFAVIMVDIFMPPSVPW